MLHPSPRSLWVVDPLGVRVAAGAQRDEVQAEGDGGGAAAFRDTQANVTKEMQGSLPMCLPIFSFLLHESIVRCTEPCRAPVVAGPIAGKQHNV
jgi:hypothetical protein